MTAPNRPIYDQYEKQGEAPAARAPDPIVELFNPPAFAPPPRRAVEPEQRPPLLRNAGPEKPALVRNPGDVAGAAKPFKFTDEGPPKPMAGFPLQEGVDYKRINLLADPGALNRDHRVGVERFDDSERVPLQVEIDSTMKRVDGRIFDSGEDKKLVPKVGRGAAKLGSADGTLVWPVPEDWEDNGIMWICVCPPGSDDVKFYSAVCRVDKVHHTSVGTNGIICAGEWIVRKGKLARVSANSGHFRPKIDALYRAILHLSLARQGDSTIYLFDTKQKTWVDVAWADFIAKPTGGGRYTTHPDSPLPAAT